MMFVMIVSVSRSGWLTYFNWPFIRLVIYPMSGNDATLKINFTYLTEKAKMSCAVFLIN